MFYIQAILKPTRNCQCYKKLDHQKCWITGSVFYLQTWGGVGVHVIMFIFFIFGFQNDPHRALNISEHPGKLSYGERSFTFIIMEFLESVYISNQTTACNILNTHWNESHSPPFQQGFVGIRDINVVMKNTLDVWISFKLSKTLLEQGCITSKPTASRF